MLQEYRQPAPSASTTPENPPRRRVRPTTFVAVVWLVMTLLGIAYVPLFCVDSPWGDEWAFVPVLTGHEPWLPWLWEQHNEHRMVLPKAAYYGLFQLTHDYRTGSLVIVLGLSAMSVWLVLTARQLRGGQTHYVDAFFPIALLHWGHYENYLMGYQLCFMFVTALTLACLIRMLGVTPENRFRRGLEVGLMLILLFLCNAGGLIVAVVLAPWLLYLAMGLRREWLKAVTLILLAVLPYAYAAIYMSEYHRPEDHPPSAGVWPSLTMAVEVATMGFGKATEPLWPVSGLVVVALVTWVVMRLITTAVSEPTERSRALGMFLVLAAAGALAFSIGWGRSGFGPGMGFWSRYGLLVLPALVVIFFTGMLYGCYLREKRALVWGPFVVLLALLPFNTGVGIAYGIGHLRWARGIEDDIHAGVPLPVLVDRHVVGYGYEWGLRGIPMLRDAGVGPYVNWRGDDE